MFIYDTKNDVFDTKLVLFSIQNLTFFRLRSNMNARLHTYGGAFTRDEVEVLNEEMRTKKGSDLLQEIKELTKLVTI